MGPAAASAALLVTRAFQLQPAIILTDPVRQQGPFVSQARVLDRKGRADVVLPHLVEATVEGLGR